MHVCTYALPCHHYHMLTQQWFASILLALQLITRCVLPSLTHYAACLVLAGAMKLKDNALQAMGLIFIAQPTLMVKPEADGLVSSAISTEAPARLKIRCLGNLCELLKVPGQTSCCISGCAGLFASEPTTRSPRSDPHRCRC